MRGKRPLNGYLDRMRKNIQSLDENIEGLRNVPKAEKAGEKRARLKLLRDMIELQNMTLQAIKTHLCGRDETGAPNEPPDFYHDSNDPQVEFERSFRKFLSPWSQDDLKLKCEDCNVNNEEVTHHEFPSIDQPGSPWKILVPNEDADLCSSCARKREAGRQERVNQAKQVNPE